MNNYQIIDAKGKQWHVFWAASDEDAKILAKNGGWPATAMLVKTVASQIGDL